MTTYVYVRVPRARARSVRLFFFCSTIVRNGALERVTLVLIRTNPRSGGGTRGDDFGFAPCLFIERCDLSLRLRRRGVRRRVHAAAGGVRAVRQVARRAEHPGFNAASETGVARRRATGSVDAVRGGLFSADAVRFGFRAIGSGDPTSVRSSSGAGVDERALRGGRGVPSPNGRRRLRASSDETARNGIPDEHTKRVLFCGVWNPARVSLFSLEIVENENAVFLRFVELSAPPAPRARARGALRSRAHMATAGRASRSCAPVEGDAGVPEPALVRGATRRRRPRRRRTRPARRRARVVQEQRAAGVPGARWRRRSARRVSDSARARRSRGGGAAPRRATLQPRLRELQQTQHALAAISASTASARSRAPIEPGSPCRPAAPAPRAARGGHAARLAAPGQESDWRSSASTSLGPGGSSRGAPPPAWAPRSPPFTSRSRRLARRHRAPELAHGQRPAQRRRRRRRRLRR